LQLEYPHLMFLKSYHLYNTKALNLLIGGFLTLQG